MINFKNNGNNSAMKAKLTRVILLIALSLLTTLTTACNVDSTSKEHSKSADFGLQRVQDSVVRIHIRANSNQELDQAVKLLVRDEITSYLGHALEGCTSKAEALCAIRNHVNNLKQIADCTLYNNGFDYKSAVSVKKEWFPVRKYNEHVFPDGVYDALIIELGSGAGDNWWCVAFPPLCFVPGGDDETVTYKSWVKEILDKIF